MRDSITFTRRTKAAEYTPALYSSAPGWSLEVWPDEKEHPITLHRTPSDRSAMLSLYLTEAQARALAHELLHAADVAQQASNTTTPTR